jgi:NAD-dependent SIR2 family protein deacetylase
MTDIASAKLTKLAADIKAGTIRKVVLLTGAGISCASGIPDFRSPGGLYDTLRPNLLTASEAEKRYLAAEPTGVVEKSFFYRNQFPYLEVRRPFILGTADGLWKPTISHLMSLMFERKGLLRRVFDQNIDGLHRRIGLEEPNLMEVHGSLSVIQCEFCKSPYPKELFCEKLKTTIRNIYDPNDPTSPSESTNINCLECGKAGVKPCTVLYGCSLPQGVMDAMGVDFPDHVDLLIIAGTSLTVSPACNLVQMVNDNTPRLLINDEIVGQHLGLRCRSVDSQDIHLAGTADAGFLRLATELGWLEEMWEMRDMLCDSSLEALRAALAAR